MLRTLGVVISISLADSLNPSTVGPALVMASRRNARRAVLEFGLGVVVVFLLGGLILVFGPGRAVLALVPRPSATTRFILETVVGALMLALVPVFWWRRGRVKPAREVQGSSRERSPALMGAAISVVELPTAFPYFAAIAAIVGSGLGVTRQLILLGVYNFVFVLPLLGIWGVLLIAGERAVQRLERVRAWGRQNWPTIAACVSLLAGVFVLTLGVTGLLGRQHTRLGRLSRRLRHVITP
jgi:cytochrome c biogenesis protein CcdA